MASEPEANVKPAHTTAFVVALLVLPWTVCGWWFTRSPWWVVYTVAVGVGVWAALTRWGRR